MRDRALIADCYEKGRTVFDAADRWALKAQEEIHGLAVKVHHTLTRDGKGRAAA